MLQGGSPAPRRCLMIRASGQTTITPANPMTRFNIRRNIAARLGYVPADEGSIARVNQLALADDLLQRPRIARRYEAAALLLCYKAAKADADAARAALQVAAAAAGRARKADAPIDRVFMKASCERLFFWATDRNTPV